jgi:hypothetical protein
MNEDSGNRVEVTRTTGGRHSRLIALAVVAVLAGVVYVGLSGQQHNAPAPTPPQVGDVHPTPSATPVPNVSVEVPTGYSSPTTDAYAAVLGLGQGDSFVAAFEEPEPGQLAADYQIALHGSTPIATLTIVQFTDALVADANLVGAWDVALVPPDRGAVAVLDFTAAPAVGAVALPRLAQAGYRIQATLGAAQNGVSVLSINATAGRVDVLHPQEVYEIRPIVEGVDLPATMYQLELGHLQVSGDWPSDAPRRFQFELVLVESAGTQLSDPELVGGWSLRVRAAKRVRGDGLTLLDDDVGGQDRISIMAATGYHITVTETVDQAGIRLTFDVYANLP